MLCFAFIYQLSVDFLNLTNSHPGRDLTLTTTFRIRLTPCVHSEPIPIISKRVTRKDYQDFLDFFNVKIGFRILWSFR